MTDSGLLAMPKAENAGRDTVSTTLREVSPTEETLAISALYAFNVPAFVFLS